jgi:O-antigen ligase
VSLTQTGLSLALAGALLFFSTSVYNPYTISKLLALCLGTLAAWLGFVLDDSSRAPTFGDSPILRPLTAAAAVYGLCAVFSIDPYGSLIGQYDNMLGFIPVFMCLCLALAAALSPDARSPESLMKTALAAGAVLGAYGILQWLGIEPFSAVMKDLPGGRIFSASGTPPFLGACLLLLCPIALHFALSPKKEEKIWAAVCAPLIAAALLLSLSRGAYLGAASGCALYLFLTRGPRLKKPSTPVCAALGALLLLVLFGPLLLIGQFRAHRGADSNRLHTWRIAALSLPDHPILGAGPDTGKNISLKYRDDVSVRALGIRKSPGHAHNDILQIAVSAGIAGIAAYLWLLYALASACKTKLGDKKLKGPAAAFAGALFGLFVNAKFNPIPISALTVAAVWAGLLAGRSSGGLHEKIEKYAAIGFSVLAGAALIYATSLTAADHFREIARRERAAGRPNEAIRYFSKAVRYAPLEISYKRDYANFLITSLRSLPKREERTRVLNTIRSLSETALKRHPEDAGAHQMRGIVLWLAHRSEAADTLEEATRVLDEAQKRNFYHAPLRELRIQVAKDRGDAKKLEALEKEKRHIRRVIPPTEPGAEQ